MKLLDRAQKTNLYLGEQIVQPLLALVILVTAIVWFTYWIKPLFLYSADEYLDPGGWYDIAALLSISTSLYFIAFIAVKNGRLSY